MKYDGVVEAAEAELLAAVRTAVPIRDVARAWKPALDQVWAFLTATGDPALLETTVKYLLA
jgi:hypothetical protein